MLPRGIRNNNPGNIEYGPFAQSAGAVGSDGRFAIFPDMNAGESAITRLLRSYAKRGYNTPNKIINRWAPSSENNVGAYVGSVSSRSGIEPDQAINFDDPVQVQRFVQAMIMHENGMLPKGSTPIGPSTKGGSAQAVAPMDRLKAALSGKTYDPDKLSSADDLIDRGRNIASTSGNPIGAIGGTILAGFGGYERGQERGNEKAYRSELGQTLSGAQDPMSAARTLMASPDPKLQEAGINMFAQASSAQQRAAQEAAKRGLTPVPMQNDATGQIEYGTVGADGTWKPLATEGNYRAAPRTTQKDTGTEIVTYDVFGNEIGRTAKDVAGKKEQEKVGEARGEAIAQMPQVEGRANDMIATIDDVLKDPYLPSMTGWVSGRLPNAGENAARVQSKLDKLQGQTFLQGYQMLKGGGVITDFEGTKAEQAIGRLGDPTMSDEDFRAALQELRDVVNAGLERARAGTRVGTPQAETSAETPTTQPDTVNDPLGILN